MGYYRTAAFERRHRAKLVATLGPEPVVAKPWFLDWSLYHFVGTPGGYHRPQFPAHLTTAENPGVFREWARLEMWRLRKRASIPYPARGLWKGGRLPDWAVTVSKEMDKHGVHPLPPPQPPPTPQPKPNPGLTALAQQVMFTAWRPPDGLRANGGKLSISADTGVAGNPAEHTASAIRTVQAAHAEGTKVSAWGNQTQVGVNHMYAFAQQIGADYIIWQAETIGEMMDFGINTDGTIVPESPLARTPSVLVGNANAWTADQRGAAQRQINEGRLAFMQEVYSNEGGPWPNSFGTQGVMCASICIGVGWGRYPVQLPEYKQHTPAAFLPSMCIYIAETMSDVSWSEMPW